MLKGLLIACEHRGGEVGVVARLRGDLALHVEVAVSTQGAAVGNGNAVVLALRKRICADALRAEKCCHAGWSPQLVEAVDVLLPRGTTPLPRELSLEPPYDGLRLSTRFVVGRIPARKGDEVAAAAAPPLAARTWARRARAAGPAEAGDGIGSSPLPAASVEAATW